MASWPEGEANERGLEDARAGGYEGAREANERGREGARTGGHEGTREAIRVRGGASG